MTQARSLACQQLVELVTAYLDDVLTDSDRIRVQEHLAECDDCAGYVAQMRTVISLAAETLENDSDPALPSGMLTDLLTVFRSINLP